MHRQTPPTSSSTAGPASVERVTVGHPVDVATGAVYTAATDWRIPGDVPIRQRRFYSTSSLAATPLGHGWSSEWFMGLHETDEHFVLTNDEGQPVRFAPPSTESASINPGAEMELSRRDRYVVVYYWHHLQRFVFEPGGRGDYRLHAIENLSGDQVRLVYDSGRLARIVVSSDRVIAIRYSGDGFVRQMELEQRDAAPLVLVRYEHDQHGNLTAVLDRGGGATRYEYDAARRLVGETNRVGARFTFSYDETGRCIHTAGTDGYLERRLKYLPHGRGTVVTDSQGAVTTYFYDASGAVSRIVNAEGAETRRIRTGSVRQEVRPNGAIVQKDYDASGNVVRSSSASGGVTTYEYNALHLCTKRTNPDGNAWTFDYDDRGRPVRVVNPSGGEWRFQCNRHGRIELVTNPRGHSTSFGHDRYGNCIERRDADGVASRFGYDELGRLVEMVDRGGRRHRYQYDQRGWLTSIERNGRRVAAYAYDAEGHIVEFVGEAGQRSALRYSPWGLRVASSKIGADGATLSATTYEYDTEGRLTSLLDPEGRRLRFGFDACGRLSRTVFGDGSVEERRYDPSGNVIEISADGRPLVTYAYDAANRLVEKESLGSGKATLTYDCMGRITDATNDWTHVSLHYDAMGNPVEEQQDGIALRRTFDAMGNCVGLVVPDLLQMTYEYDPMQRVSCMTGPDARAHRFVHDNRYDVPASHEHPNGLLDTCEFDPDRGSITQRTVPSGFSAAYAKVTRQHKIERSGRVIESIESDNTRRFEFDALGRLSAVVRDRKRANVFGYDLSGNITSDASTGAKSYDARNRLLRTRDARYEYPDPLTCVLTDVNTGSRVTYNFDGEGRLLEVATPSTRVTFRYDAFGRRISKSSDEGETKFWWDGTSLLREHSSAGEECYYTFVPRCFRPVSKLVPRTDGRGLHWQAFDYHLDLLGTPREISDERGEIVWAADYEPYGTARVRIGDPTLNRIRFPGQYADAETGLCYNIYRYYDPRLGRYISEDPIGFSSSSLNLFSYPADPVNRTDALGLDCGDPDAVHIYHGTLDEDKLRETGFTTKDKYGGDAAPPYVCVSTDRRAAADALNPNTRVDAQYAAAPALLTGSMPKAEWDRLHAEGHLTTNDYGGFHSNMDSSETKARTPEGVAALNKAFGLPGGT